MKANIGKWAAVVFLSALNLGCSSIRARDATPRNDWKVYPGVRQDVNDMGDIFTSNNPEPLWVKGMVTTILLIDLPFSTVFDTLATPYDLYRIYTPEDSQ